MKIATSILNMKKDSEHFNQLNHTTTDFIHLDIMDGNFVCNQSDMFDFVNNNIVEKPLDIHLMVQNPIPYIEKYSKLNPNNITVHYEADCLLESLHSIKEKNIKVGLAINPKTDVHQIEECLDKIDLLLIMSVEPGLGGQSYIDVSNKLKDARNLQKKYSFVIEVDGGIKDNNIASIDADIAVVGSFITSKEDFQKQIDELKKQL